MKIDFRKYSCLPLMRPTHSVLKKWSCNYYVKIDFQKIQVSLLKGHCFEKSGFVQEQPLVSMTIKQYFTDKQGCQVFGNSNAWDFTKCMKIKGKITTSKEYS